MSKKVGALPSEPQLKTRSSDPTNYIVLQVQADAKIVIKKSRPGRKSPPKASLGMAVLRLGMPPDRVPGRHPLKQGGKLGGRIIHPIAQSTIRLSASLWG